MKNFIIPSIDLLDGQIVRLYKGDYGQKTVYNIEIEDLLLKYNGFSNLHIVDLNGARGDNMTNLQIITNIRKLFSGKIQLGGGIRSSDISNHIINEVGIDRCVLGTIAITNFDLTKNIINSFGCEKIVLAIDCKFEDAKWIPKSNGWKDGVDYDLFQILSEYNNLAKYILVTDISVDGTMQGSNIDLYREIKSKFPEFVLQASGGVSSISDLQNLKDITDFSIVGKALYGNLLNEI